MEPSEGFPPVARSDARVLILGSLPGVRSITDNEYYAHPQNAFWKIMGELYGVDGSYAERCAQLIEAQIAVWDVLRASVRPGSLDSDIRLDTAEANDFAGFLDTHSQIQIIAFNGRKAEQLFARCVELPKHLPISTVGLPSTSPAYASLSFSGKLDAWRTGLRA